MSKFSGAGINGKGFSIGAMEDVLFPDTIDRDDCASYKKEILGVFEEHARKKDLNLTTASPDVAKFFETALAVSFRQNKRDDLEFQYLAALLSVDVTIKAARVFRKHGDQAFAIIANDGLNLTNQSLHNLRHLDSEGLSFSLDLAFTLLKNLQPMQYATACVKDMIINDYERLSLMAPEDFSKTMAKHSESIDQANKDLVDVLQRSFYRAVTHPGMDLKDSLLICRETIPALPILGDKAVQAYRDICEHAAKEYDNRAIKDICDDHWKACQKLKKMGVNTELLDIALEAHKNRHFPTRPWSAQISPDGQYFGNYLRLN